MTNRKTTRRALVLSLLSLLVCCSMLVGTTFAWFTDSVQSGKNQIVAGNLDVELYYQVEGQSDWTKVTGNSNVFKENTLWEPGHTEVVKLKVVNEGTLSLKYQLGVNIVSETGSKNVLGNEFKLSDYIKFGVVEGAQTYNREQAIAAVEANATALNVGYGTGTVKLDPKTETNTDNEDIVTMVVYMPTSVDNNANYAKGEAVPTILLGLNLYATQVEAESDSFGPEYDAGVDFAVTNASELLNALAVGGDILAVGTMDAEGVQTPFEEYPGETAEYYVLGKKVNSLSGGTYTIDEGAKYGIYADTASSQGGNISFSDMKITADSKWSFVIENDATGIVTVENVEIVAQSGAGLYGVGGKVVLDDVKVNHLAFDPAYSDTPWGATALAAAGAVDMTINSGEYYGSTYGLYVYSSGGNVTINGGTFKAPVVVAADAQNGANAYVTINGGNFDGKFESVNVFGGSEALITINGGNFTNFSTTANERITIKGGTFDADPTQWLAAGYKALQINGKWEVVPTTTNYVTTSDELVAAINEAADGSTIMVAAGEYALRFTNNTAFNVDNLTIQGMGEVKLAITSSEVHYGRIQGDGVTFENIHFTDATVGATGKATYNNCTFDGRLEMASSGGKETYANDCTMKNVHTSGDMGAGNGYFTDCTMDLAEYGNTSHNPTLTFTDCTIGTLKPWNVNTELKNTTVQTMDLSGVTTASVKVDGVSVVGNNDALKAVVGNGAAEVKLLDGEYDLNGIQKAGLTLTGIGTDVKVANTTKYAGGKSVGAIWQPINLENVTITNTVYTMAEGGKATFKNVYFAAGFRQGYGTGVVFEGCTFGSNTEGYALHFQTDSASEGGKITLTECEFEGGKVHLGGKRAYEFTGCEFAEGTDFQVWSTITLDGCTVNGEAVTAANAATLFPNLDLAKVTIQ